MLLFTVQYDVQKLYNSTGFLSYEILFFFIMKDPIGNRRGPPRPHHEGRR